MKCLGRETYKHQSYRAETLNLCGSRGDIKYFRRIMPMFDQRNGRYHAHSKSNKCRLSPCCFDGTIKDSRHMLPGLRQSEHLTGQSRRLFFARTSDTSTSMIIWAGCLPLRRFVSSRSHFVKKIPKAKRTNDVSASADHTQSQMVSEDKTQSQVRFSAGRRSQ